MDSSQMHAETETVRLIASLKPFITPERFGRFTEVLAARTRYLTIVLQDIFQPHNASAVLRSCDCFGIQDVHIIENRNRYQVNPDVALGSSQWLSLRRYNTPDADNTMECIKYLKMNGYRIIATSPHCFESTPETLPLDQKTALIFGTELEGLSETALSLADGSIRIPMVGFTESLNISVSAAIIMQTLGQRIRNSSFPWQLSEEEAHELLLDWLKNSIKSSDALVRKFRQEITRS